MQAKRTIVGNTEAVVSPMESGKGLHIPDFKSKTTLIGNVRIHCWQGGNPDGAPGLLWHGFLGTAYSWRHVMTQLADAGYVVLAPDMRGYGDSDKPTGTDGYDGRALAEEFRSLIREIGFGAGRPLTLVAHDMGAPPALLWAADHPAEIATLFYLEAPVMLQEVLGATIAYTPEAMQNGSMWWWILPLAPGVPERVIVGNERELLNWFYEGSTAKPEAIGPKVINEYLRTFSGVDGVLGALEVYRAAFRTIQQTAPLTKPESAHACRGVGWRESSRRAGWRNGCVIGRDG